MKQARLIQPQSNKRMRKRKFLDSVGRVAPWTDLVAPVEPYLPEVGRRGQKPFATETMLRIHFLEQRFNLSDPAMEEALHDVPLLRDFAGLSSWDDALPSETSILRFGKTQNPRHRLERHKISPNPGSSQRPAHGKGTVAE